MKNLTNLTPNQSEIIHNLIEEFKQMNTSRVSEGNPLLAIFSEVQSNKIHCEELTKIGEARKRALLKEIGDDLQQLSDYFDELGFELEPIWNDSADSSSLSYRIRGEEMICIRGYINCDWERVGEYMYQVGHTIRYELKYRSSVCYNSLNGLIESDEFKKKVSFFLKHLLKTQQDAKTRCNR